MHVKALKKEYIIIIIISRFFWSFSKYILIDKPIYNIIINILDIIIDREMHVHRCNLFLSELNMLFLDNNKYFSYNFTLALIRDNLFTEIIRKNNLYKISIPKIG